ASGRRAFGVDTWHRLSLELNGSQIHAAIDGHPLATVRDSTYNSGHVGLMVSKWNNAQFDNLTVRQVGAPGVVTMLGDADQGTGLNQFDYQGAGWTHCISCGSDLFHGGNSFDAVAGDTVTVRFVGRQVTFFGVRARNHGIGAVSIDGGPETGVDFFAPYRAGTQPLWTSPLLPAGPHTFTLRVTGMTHDGGSGAFVVP